LAYQTLWRLRPRHRAIGKPMGSNPVRYLPLSPANSWLDGLKVRKMCCLGKKSFAPHNLMMASCRRLGLAVGGMKANEDLSPQNQRALVRHSAIIWIEQCRNSGSCFGECVKRAAELAWGGRFFAARTLEDWYYAHRQGGFSRLQSRPRKVKNCIRQNAYRQTSHTTLG